MATKRKRKSPVEQKPALTIAGYVGFQKLRHPRATRFHLFEPGAATALCSVKLEKEFTAVPCPYPMICTWCRGRVGGYRAKGGR